MTKKRKQRKKDKLRKKERSLRNVLNNAINKFDVPFGGNPEMLPAYPAVREQFLPQLLKMYLKECRITQEKHDQLIAQLNGGDREDWYLAFVLIRQLRATWKK